MSYLLDTNVLSELRKGAHINPAVSAWYATIDANSIYLSVLVTAEIRRGIEGLRRREPERATTLDEWLEAVIEGFADRILPIDAAVAERWAYLTAGRSFPVVDALLAATADVHRLVLVTRNRADVADLGVAVLNPFEPAA
ncbi:type II toxin-antitoxin system VapC family toxin [Pseudoxanthobacter sp. M-2]|uniref:type II toxin-antitoxin system VapC family toxin n=1 Tax=Pseudoxanthobacter sp. M-2 TaxID=3078754 RepID=UPI0038FD05BB